MLFGVFFGQWGVQDFGRCAAYSQLHPARIKQFIQMYEMPPRVLFKTEPLLAYFNSVRKLRRIGW